MSDLVTGCPVRVGYPYRFHCIAFIANDPPGGSESQCRISNLFS